MEYSYPYSGVPHIRQFDRQTFGSAPKIARCQKPGSKRISNALGLSSVFQKVVKITALNKGRKESREM
jgi:hypothetical protein